MNVPAPLEITASLMAGYTLDDGSLVEVDQYGDYRITDANGTVIAETVDSHPGEGYGLRFGTTPEDYGEIMDDLAGFLCHDGQFFYYEADWPMPDELNFSEAVAMWAGKHYDELSILACYREDKRLGEGQFAKEED